MDRKLRLKTVSAPAVILMGLILSCSQETTPPPPPPPESANLAVIKVFYATDRKPSPETVINFEGQRGDGSLHYGVFQVSVPRDHRLAIIERPSIWRFEFKETPAKHFVIVSRTAQDEAVFYQDVSKTVKAQVISRCHGFNVGFDDAVYRTAQISYDLGLSG